MRTSATSRFHRLRPSNPQDVLRHGSRIAAECGLRVTAKKNVRPRQLGADHGNGERGGPAQPFSRAGPPHLEREAFLLDALQDAYRFIGAGAGGLAGFAGFAGVAGRGAMPVVAFCAFQYSKLGAALS